MGLRKKKTNGVCSPTLKAHEAHILWETTMSNL